LKKRLRYSVFAKDPIEKRTRASARGAYHPVPIKCVSKRGNQLQLRGRAPFRLRMKTARKRVGNYRKREVSPETFGEGILRKRSKPYLRGVLGLGEYQLKKTPHFFLKRGGELGRQRTGGGERRIKQLNI